MEDVALSLSATGLFYIFFLFLYKIHDVADLIKELENYEPFGKPHDADHINKSCNFYSKLFYVYCFSAASLFFAFNQTIGATHCREKNEKFNRDEVCGFFTHVWLPFDYNFTPAYEMMAVFQYFVCIYATPAFTICFMVFVMLQHLVCKIRHLKRMAEDIFEIQDSYEQKERLITCIRYHQYIIRFYLKLSALFII